MLSVRGSLLSLIISALLPKTGCETLARHSCLSKGGELYLFWISCSTEFMLVQSQFYLLL